MYDYHQQTTLHHLLLTWFAQSSRDLPWRTTRDPYHILTAEMMLQQTQVDRVLPKYNAFIQAFPTIATLAAASTADVIRMWAGLGYNRRAVNLQRIAHILLEQHNGTFPHDPTQLQQLPGIGPYTAGAIACFAFEQDVAFLDTNMRRVLLRCCLGNPTPSPHERELLLLAQNLIPNGQGWHWNQALMELGALICTARSPICPQCPLKTMCHMVNSHISLPTTITYQSSTTTNVSAQSSVKIAERRAPFKGSNRYYRGRIIALLRDIPPESFATLAYIKTTLAEEPHHTDEWLHKLIDGLVRDGLIEQAGEQVRLPSLPSLSSM